MCWALWMRSWSRASFCEKHCICCRLRISWSICLGVQRYESLLALSSALLPLNTGDWVLDIRPSGHHIHTHITLSLTHTHTDKHTHTRHTYIIQVESDSQFPHNSQELGTEKLNIWLWNKHYIKFAIKLLTLYIYILYIYFWPMSIVSKVKYIHFFNK